MAATDLAELAAEALVQVVEALGTDAPSRQIIAVGTPAADGCDQVAVSALQVRRAQTGAQEQLALGLACQTLTLVDLRITLTDCVPSVSESGEPPSVADLNSSANRLYALAWTMWCGLHNRRRSGDLFGSEPGRSVSVGGLEAIEPLGGRAGWAVDLQVQLDPDPDLGAA